MKQNPWLGLATYDETLISKGYKFCGRERAINELYSIIDNNIITTLYGKSGIGKSSLMQAGIFPLCRFNNYLPVMIRLGVGNNSTSASSYIDTVIASVEQCIQAINGTIQKNNNNTSTVQDTEKLWHYFHSSQFRNSNNDVIFPVIVLDQFEELYYRDRDQLNTLLKSIYLLLDDSSINGNSNESQIINYRIVISIREDDLFHLEDSIDKLRLTEMKDNRYRLRDFSEDEAFSVITVPGDNVFDKDDINSIADLIIKETKANSTEISSAVLSLICSRIFSSVKENRLITLNDVNLFFKDAQGNFLKSFYEDIRKKLTLEQWYFIEDELVTDEGRRDSVPESEFDKVIPDSLWLFEGEHSMLRKVTIQGSSEPRIEIIHDMLAMQMLSSKKERKLQEQARKLRRQRLTAFAIIAVIIALSVTFYLQYRSIVEERNNMYKMQSHYITEKAEKLIEEGNVNTAIRLLLKVLPENVEQPNRPYIEEAEYALRKANKTFQNSIIRNIKQFCHKEAVRSAQFSPNGEYIVTSSSDSTAKIWNTKTGKQIGSDFKHSSRVDFTKFSPDGKFIITISGNNISKIWDITSQQQIGTDIQFSNSLNSDIQFSPTYEHFIISSRDGTANIIDIKTSQQIGKTLKHNSFIYETHYSPNGKYIVTTSADSTAKIWDAQTGSLIKTFKHPNSVESAHFNPNNNIVITADFKGIVRFWDIETAQPLKKELAHNEHINFVRYFPKGDRIISVSSRNAIVWDTEKLEPLYEYNFYGHISDIQFSPNGEYFILSSWDKVARIFNTKTGEQVGETLKHKASVSSASFSPDGKFVVTASDDKTARIWDFTPQCFNNIIYTEKANLIKYSKDGKYIATSHNNIVKIWEVNSGDQIGSDLKHNEYITDFDFSSDGEMIVTINNDSITTIWNIHTSKLIKRMTTKHNLNLQAISISPNNKYIATASLDGTAKIWDIETSKQIGNIIKHFSPINSIHFSSNSKYVVTSSCDNSAKISNATSGIHIGKTYKHTDWDSSYVVYPNGTMSITFGNISWVYNAKFSSDNNYIVTASADSTAKIWDIHSNKQIGSDFKHNYPLDNVMFSPNGKYIITTSTLTDYATVKIWEIQEHRIIGHILQSNEHITSMDINPKGNSIVTITQDGTIEFTEFIPLQNLIDRYKKLFGDWSLTEEELKEYNFK